MDFKQVIVWLNVTVCIVLLNFAQSNVAGYILQCKSIEGRSFSLAVDSNVVEFVKGEI